MTIEEKRMLVVLLRKYQADLLETEAKNEGAKKDYKKWTREFYDNYQNGIKSQYNHARIIANKLDTEIGKSIKTIYF